MQKKSEQEKNSKWVGAGGGGRKKMLIRTLLNYSGETLSPVNVYFLFFNSMLCFFSSYVNSRVLVALADGTVAIFHRASGKLILGPFIRGKIRRELSV